MKKVLTLREVNVKGKVVFVRAAYDVPLDSTKSLLNPQRVRDDSRIGDTVPTLAYLIKNNAKIILAAGWVGRPKSEDPELSMAPVALRLQQILKEEGMLKHPVLLTPNCLDGSKPRSVYRNKEEVVRDAAKTKEGQIIVLENVRYDDEANANDENFAKFIASLAGKNAVYVNEAEAQNHRPEATVVAVPKLIVKNGGKAVFGFKVAEAIKYIGSMSSLLNKKGRGAFIFFLSGKKIETQVGITSKITVTHALLDKMKQGDVVVAQGAVTYTFIVANEFIGVIEKKIKEAELIIAKYGKLSKEQTEENQKQKSDELKKLLGINDAQIKSLIGNSFVEWKEIGEQIIFAAQLLLKARPKGVKMLLCLDHTIANNCPDKYGNLPPDSEIKFYNSPTGIPEGWAGVAPGPKTIGAICYEVKKCSLLILAGPLSIEDVKVEQISKVNANLLKSIKEAKEKGAITIGAGGDTAAIIRKWNGESAFTIMSNAGGATLELIEKGDKLPGIMAVEECYSKIKQQP